ncbi:MAG: M17 family peptidase N-terminal domain-containing protein, partial [Planctomycetota bacterium]
MDLRILTTPLGTHRDEAAVLLLSKQDDAKRLVSAVGRTFARAFEALWDRKAFEPAAGNLRVLQQGSRQAIPTLVVVGYGPVDGSMLEGMRRAASEGARAARAAGARSVTLVVPRATKGATRTRARAEAVTEGAVMGLYRFETHKGKKDEQVVTRLTVLAKRGEQAQAKRGAEAGRIVADGVALARDLGNEPGNRATPTYLAETAERIAKTDGLTCRVLEESEMKALGMGGLLGVSQGSQQPAKLILLTYEPPRRKRRPPTVAIVGKGL